jgi:hypothetical protein
MARNVIAGTTITDLSRSAREAEQNDLQQAAQFFQLMSRQAELKARQNEAAQDRALRYYQVGSEQSLKEKALANEQRRLEQEANRFQETLKFQGEQGAAGRQSAEKIAGMQFNPVLMGGRSVGDLANLGANVSEANAKAAAAASKANALLGVAKAKRDRSANNIGGILGMSPLWTTPDEATDEYSKDLNAIMSGLGPDAGLVAFDRGSDQFVPVPISAPRIGTPGATSDGMGAAPMFLPPPGDTEAGVGMAPLPVSSGSANMENVPWTLIGPDGRAQTFASREERDAAYRALIASAPPPSRTGMQPAAPVPVVPVTNAGAGKLRWNPQTQSWY